MSTARRPPLRTTAPGVRPAWARIDGCFRTFQFRGVTRVAALSRALSVAVLEDAGGRTIGVPLGPAEADELRRTLEGSAAAAALLLNALKRSRVDVRHAILARVRGLEVDGGLAFVGSHGDETWVRCSGALVVTVAALCNLDVLVSPNVAREMESTALRGGTVRRRPQTNRPRVPGK